MKIKLYSDDNLPLNKTIEIPIVATVIRAAFHDNNTYYPQVKINIYTKYKNFILW